MYVPTVLSAWVWVGVSVEVTSIYWQETMKRLVASDVCFGVDEKHARQKNHDVQRSSILRR